MADRFHETSTDAVGASRVLIGACACPDVHILLLDASGAIVARAVMSPEEFAEAAKNVAVHVAAVREAQGDTIGDVAGNA